MEQDPSTSIQSDMLTQTAPFSQYDESEAYVPIQANTLYSDTDTYTLPSSEQSQHIDTIEYQYISPELLLNAPCPESGQNPDAPLSVMLYIYAMGTTRLDGPSKEAMTQQNSLLSASRFLPNPNMYYPYVKVKAMASNNTLTFPKMDNYTCITESDAGNMRFANQCIQALGKLFPEWDTVMQERPDIISSIYCGYIETPSDTNDSPDICAILNVTNLQHVQTSSMNWYILDELLYSPDIWSIEPRALAMFKAHSSLQYVWVRGQSKMEIGPTPLCVYSVRPDSADATTYVDEEALLPFMHPQWGWVYAYASRPMHNTAQRHVGFMVHVTYALGGESSSELEKQWERSSILYQQVAGRIIWFTRQPFPILVRDIENE